MEGLSTISSSSKDVIVKIKYDNQRDGWVSPYGACGPTALAMAMSKYDVSMSQDEAWAVCNSPDSISRTRRLLAWAGQWLKKGTLNQLWDVICWAGRYILANKDIRYGKNRKAITVKEKNTIFIDWIMTEDEIKKALREGSILVFSRKFTSSGHFSVLKGYNDEKGYWIVNDPWGDPTTRYRNMSGASIKLSYENWNKLILEPKVATKKKDVGSFIVFK